MIPGDLSAELAAILQAGAAAGELPAQAGQLTAAGTWRPAPPQAGGGPGRYATPLPFALAAVTGQPARGLAAGLAAGLSGRPCVARAAVTGSGYLTVTVTAAHLAALAPRILAAGPGCAGSDALAGTCAAACPDRDLRAASGWGQARRWHADAVISRMCAAAGATITARPERHLPARQPARPDPALADAMQYAGADAVRYALTRAPAGGAMTGRQACVPGGAPSPYQAVVSAHADAASALRWAADLGLAPGAAAEGAPRLLGHPRERALLDAMSWLPERVAGAARRAQPRELTAYLEELAAQWISCRESCPALPFGGRAAPRDAAVTAARLQLAAAAATTLRAGLALIGVTAPDRV